MTEHKVKSWCRLFKAALSGEKTHDVRRCDDRDYKVGDVLILQEYDQTKYCYTGRELKMIITYITSNDNPCALSENALKEGYCILSMKKYEEVDHNWIKPDYMDVSYMDISFDVADYDTVLNHEFVVKKYPGTTFQVKK